MGAARADSSAIYLTTFGRASQGTRRPRRRRGVADGPSRPSLRCRPVSISADLVPCPLARPSRSRDRGNEPADPAAKRETTMTTMALAQAVFQHAHDFYDTD